MKQHEYVEKRPVSFLDLLAANAATPEAFYWGRLAYQVTLIVTQVCNMKCTYCYDKSRIDNEVERKELSADEFVRIIEDARSLGVQQFKLTGGETFLKKGIGKILRACEGTALYLCTNSNFLHRWTRFLSELSFEQLHIHTSLDGLESHSKYAKGGTSAYEVLEAIRVAKIQIPHLHTSINTVLNVENVHELEDMYTRIVDALADKWTISTPYIVSEVVRNNHPFPDFEEVAEASARLLQKHFAWGEPIHLSIGGMYKYEMFDIKTLPPRKTDEHPCMPNCNGCRGIVIDSFGNVLDCLLENSEEKGALRDFKEGTFVPLTITSAERPFYRMKIGDSPECGTCRYVAICGGGCRYNAQTVFGNQTYPDPIRCSYYPLMEKHILPVLPREQRECAEEYLDLQGNMPTQRYQNVNDILEAFSLAKSSDST